MRAKRWSHFMNGLKSLAITLVVVGLCFAALSKNPLLSWPFLGLSCLYGVGILVAIHLTLSMGFT